MLIRSGITLVKYWFSVSDDEQEKRFRKRIKEAHLLSLVPYDDLTPQPIELPPRQPDTGYVRPPLESQPFIPQVY